MKVEVDITTLVKNQLYTMHKLSQIEPWQYELIRLEPQKFESIASCVARECEASGYDMLQYSIRCRINQEAKHLELNDASIKALWEGMEDITFDEGENDELICSEYLGFPPRTPREDLWHWFDENYSKGITALLYGEESAI